MKTLMFMSAIIAAESIPVGSMTNTFRVGNKWANALHAGEIIQLGDADTKEPFAQAVVNEVLVGRWPILKHHVNANIVRYDQSVTSSLDLALYEQLKTIYDGKDGRELFDQQTSEITVIYFSRLRDWDPADASADLSMTTTKADADSALTTNGSIDGQPATPAPAPIPSPPAPAPASAADASGQTSSDAPTSPAATSANTLNDAPSNDAPGNDAPGNDTMNSTTGGIDSLSAGVAEDLSLLGNDSITVVNDALAAGNDSPAAGTQSDAQTSDQSGNTAGNPV